MGSLGAWERNCFPKLSSVSFPGSWGWTAGYLLSKFSCGHCIRTGTMGCARRHCCLVAQLCSTLWDSMDYCPPGSSIHGISQVRILEWVAICFSRGSSRPRDGTCVYYIGKQILYSWATSEARPQTFASHWKRRGRSLKEDPLKEDPGTAYTKP